MNLKTWTLPLITALILGLSPLQGQADPQKLNAERPGRLTGDQTIPNLGVGKLLIKDYYQSGRYAAEVRAVTQQATAYIDEYLSTRPKDAPKEKLAMILDIDETCLSNAPHILQFDFAYLPAEWDKWILSAKAPAIDGSLELYKHAQEKGVAIFFITGRGESERSHTAKNLEEVGFKKWTALIMRADGVQVNAKDYKTYHRKQITESGYHIIINMGDQMSDLEGGYSDAVYKLPNPMYYIP